MPRLSGFLVSSAHNAFVSLQQVPKSVRFRKNVLQVPVSALPCSSRRCFSMKTKSFHTIPLPQIGAYEEETSSLMNVAHEPKLNILDGNVSKLMSNRISSGSQDAFYVVDLCAIAKRHKLWQNLLPMVKPFYAVKCNPDEKILQMLQSLGCGFDCASKEEIDAALRTGIAPSDIIYANPCKQLSHIQYAKQKEVAMMTFDSCDELTKVKLSHPAAKLVLRLLVDDSHSQCQLGAKFGAPIEQVPELLSYARKLGLNVVGVSFHVGSGCFNTAAYSNAVIQSRKAFDMAKVAGYDLSLLDIGGGFPGDSSGPISFEEIACELNNALDEHFPKESNIDIIAEPGRFYVASSHILAVNVIGRKLVSRPPLAGAYKIATCNGSRHIHASSPHYMYYVNDGVYGSFNCLLYDHAHVYPKALHTSGFEDTPAYSCSVWGPTCDGLDCISKEASLPLMNIGQWIYFEGMGAYTSAAGSCFNGFQPPEKIYFQDE